MIPYFGWTTIPLFGFSLQVWGALVAAGYALATYLAWKRAKRCSLDAERVLDLLVWMLPAVFVMARVFHVAVYEPAYYLEHPLEAIDPRLPGYSFLGGIVGALGMFFWLFRHAFYQWKQYADAIAWGVPWGCGVGRIGCFLIHDHPGTLTHFFLGVRYPDGSVRHDLGLYLSLAGFLMGVLFLLLNHKPRGPGFWLGSYLLAEGVIRLLLDGLRLNDVRYWLFTPAQWAGFLLIGFGGYLLHSSFAAERARLKTNS